MDRLMDGSIDRSIIDRLIHKAHGIQAEEALAVARRQYVSRE